MTLIAILTSFCWLKDSIWCLGLDRIGVDGEEAEGWWFDGWWIDGWWIDGGDRILGESDDEADTASDDKLEADGDADTVDDWMINELDWGEVEDDVVDRVDGDEMGKIDSCWDDASEKGNVASIIIYGKLYIIYLTI